MDELEDLHTEQVMFFTTMQAGRGLGFRKASLSNHLLIIM